MNSDDRNYETNYFPYTTIRSGQKELIEYIETAFSSQKILLANAPTGLGKTASALAVALKYALEKDKIVFFLTNRHTQHQLAVNTLKLIQEKFKLDFAVVDLIGKKWMCNQDVAKLFGNDFNEYCKSVVEKGECEFYNRFKEKNNLTVEAKLLVKELQSQILHNEQLIALGKEKKMCSYEISLSLAKKAKVIIGDYYYLFNPYVQSTLFKKLDLEIEDIIIIVDEGHNLPSRVSEMLSSNLTSLMIKNGVIEAKKFGYPGMIVWLQELMKVLDSLAVFNTADKEKLVTKDLFRYKIESVVNYDRLLDELEQAAEEIRKKQQRSYLGGILSFLSSWLGEEEGFVRIISQKPSKYGPVTSLSYSCLDPGIVTADIFKQVHAGVIMSGTLTPTFMYRDLLGIKNSIEKDYKSPFLPENKLSLVVTKTTTRFTSRNDMMYQQMAAVCSQIEELVPGNVALFFPSYKLRDDVGLFFSSKKKLFWEKAEMSKEEKEDLLNKFKEARKEGGVLLAVTGANFAEGIDLPGDLLQGVIVVGLPLARPGIKTKEIINYYEKKFGRGWDYGYIYPAMNKCLQSSGRCIRTENDRGVVVYLDERFAWEKYYNCLPKEGLIVTQKFEEHLRKFFNEEG